MHILLCINVLPSYQASLYKILQKLGVEVTTSSQIYQLVSSELSQTSLIKEATITVNAEVLESLQQEFINHESKLQVSFIVNNQLSNDECICNTSLWALKLNVSTVIKHLSSFN
jgi:flagellar biosynthesis/type III secretory pathway protein FliH